MASAAAILALVAGILYLVAMIPQASSYPLVPVAGLLLAVAVFLVAGGH